jgi:hypothetical protein
MSKRLFSDKIKRATHLVFFRRGRKPGVKAWELKAKLGRRYEEVIEQLNELVKDLDLEVKRISDEETSTAETATKRDETKERFVVSLKGSLTLTEARLCGWRIDNLAGLAMSIAYIVSKQGKALRKEVEKILAYKFGRWRSMSMVDAFIRSDYLGEDESGLLYLNWRTYAEVDLKALGCEGSRARGQDSFSGSLNAFKTSFGNGLDNNNRAKVPSFIRKEEAFSSDLSAK